VFAPAIAAKADELGNDPARIYEFLRNEFEYQPYYGLMKGPEATLASRGGNDYDMAALLVSLLRHSEVPARFARGFIAVAAADATAWTGAAASGVVDLWRGIEPPAWSGTFFATTQLSSPTRYRRLHVWVEALVPMARYRGRDLPPADERGRIWIPLDPSFKLRDWPATIDPLGLTTDPPAVAFTYGVEGEADPGPEPYYASASSTLPSEIYEDKLRAHLAGTAVAGAAPESLESKLFRGAIRRQEPGVLPTALPYDVVTSDPGAGFFAPLRSARLSDLHRSVTTGGLSPDPLVGADGDVDYRYQWALHVCKSSQNRDHAPRDPTTPTCCSGTRIAPRRSPASASPCTSLPSIPARSIRRRASPTWTARARAARACARRSGSAAWTRSCGSMRPSTATACSSWWRRTRPWT
jgi:hypothetical protein